MYADFYNLKAFPFQLTPDPRFFFGSTVHNRAVAHLTFGLEQGEGFIVITGDVGAGKTTLVGYLLSDLDPDLYISGKIVTTHLEGDDMLRMVTSAFGLQTEAVDKASLLRRLESFLEEVDRSGKRILLVVDEAQNLSVHALEELRMLSNIQFEDRTPLQLFLLGQPQFREIMATPDLEQLKQRVIVSHHLGPLSLQETRAYIEHRLTMAGWQHDPTFTDDAFKAIYGHSGGIPRRINVLCSRLLLYGFLEEAHELNGEIVDRVADEYARETAGTGTSNGARPAEPELPEHHSGQPIERDDREYLLQRIAELDRQVKQHEAIIRKSLQIAVNYLETGTNR
ncbi:MAG: ATPase [Rhodospirillaceae bacterium]|nr:ATPase [Rhodospirillaceae bacterium]